MKRGAHSRRFSASAIIPVSQTRRFALKFVLPSVDRFATKDPRLWGRAADARGVRLHYPDQTIVRKVILFSVVAITAQVPASAMAQLPEPQVTISLAAGSPEEQQARYQLRRILATWDLSAWLFTRAARIEGRAIPHSHPVLTVNSRYLANDTAQIATFIHEQLHWFFVEQRPEAEKAIAERQRIFPNAPDAPPEGARGRHSTYLHLAVCLLEYDALASLFDHGAARRTLEGWRHYRWVYRQVLDRPDVIRAVLTRHGLAAPDARKR